MSDSVAPYVCGDVLFGGPVLLLLIVLLRETKGEKGVRRAGAMLKLLGWIFLLGIFGAAVFAVYAVIKAILSGDLP